MAISSLVRTMRIPPVSFNRISPHVKPTINFQTLFSTSTKSTSSDLLNLRGNRSQIQQVRDSFGGKLPAGVQIDQAYECNLVTEIQKAESEIEKKVGQFKNVSEIDLSQLQQLSQTQGFLNYAEKRFQQTTLKVAILEAAVANKSNVALKLYLAGSLCIYPLDQLGPFETSLLAPPLWIAGALYYTWAVMPQRFEKIEADKELNALKKLKNLSESDRLNSNNTRQIEIVKDYARLLQTKKLS